MLQVNERWIMSGGFASGQHFSIGTPAGFTEEQAAEARLHMQQTSRQQMKAFFDEADRLKLQQYQESTPIPRGR